MPSQLEAFVAEARGSDAIGAHVEHCDHCRVMVEEIRENQQFMARVGGALAASGFAWRGRSRDLPPPGTVPGYELIEEISRGGQGVVYRAVQSATKRPAAVKMLLSGAFASGHQRRRFEREIEIAARLRHPCIVSVFDSDITTDERRYVAMEFVPGEPLDIYVREHCPLQRGAQRGSQRGGQKARVDQIMRLMRDVAEGVGFAHANGVIHRDLKPSNILVDSNGKPRVVDFGLARATETNTLVTVTMEFAGTLAYAAPEQFKPDLGLVGTQTDVYALGLILYILLTEQRPYPCEGPLAEVSEHAVSTEPAPLSKHVPRIPSDVETIVLKALAKEPSRRYSSAAALAADIDDYLAGRPISARRDSTLYVLQRLAVKHRVPSIAVAVVVLTIVAAAAGLTLLARDLDVQRRQTAEVQTQNTIQRARAMASGGEQQHSEQTLWQKALTAGVDAGSPQLGFEEPLKIRQPVWALMEYYSGVPRIARFTAGPGEVFRVRVDSEQKTIHADAVNGASSTWTLSGDLVDSSPPWDDVARAGGARKAPHSGAWHAIAENGVLRVADARTRETLGGPIALHTPLRSFVVSRLGAYVAVVDARGALRVFAGPDLRERPGLWMLDTDYEAVGFSENEQWIVATSRANATRPPRVHVWSTTVQSIFVRPCTARQAQLSQGEHLTAPAVSNQGDWAVAAARNDLFAWWTAGDPEPVDRTNTDADLCMIDIHDTHPRLVVGSASGSVRFGSYTNLRATLRRQVPARVTCVDRSEQLGVIAVGDRSGSVSLFDMDDHGWIRTPWSHHWGGSTAAAASIDGRWYAWAPDGGGVGVGSMAEGEPNRLLSELEVRYLAVDFTMDSSQIVAGSLDGRVCLFGVEDGRLHRVIAQGLPPVWSVRASPDGQWLAAGCEDGVLRVWTMSDLNAPPRTIQDQGGRIARITFSPDSSLVATAQLEGPQGQPGAAVVRHLATGREIWRWTAAPLISVRAVAFSPDGNHVAVGSDEPTVKTWNVRTGDRVSHILGVPWDVFDLAYDPTGRVLYAVGRGPALLAYDPSSGIELATFRVHQQNINTIAVRSDGLQLVTCGDDSWIGLWDLDKLRRNVRGNARYWQQQLRTPMSSR